MTGTPILEDAHLRHLDEQLFYLQMVEVALDSNRRSRRSSTKDLREGSVRDGTSRHEPTCKTSEAQKTQSTQ